MKSRRNPHSPLRHWIWLIAGVLLLLAWQAFEHRTDPVRPASPDNNRTVDHRTTPSDTALAFLPREAHTTLALIDRGGPYPYRQDGTIFQNREGRLPQRPHRHYREYTVDTPGLDHRGARRIVTGGEPPREWYYTADHYRSFRAFQRQDQP